MWRNLPRRRPRPRLRQSCQCLSQRRLAAGLPGRVRPPSKLPRLNSKHERRLAENKRWDDTILDRGPIPRMFYDRHESTILQPQFSGREAWTGLLGLSGLNFVVISLWNDDENKDPKAHKEWQTWMHQNFTTNITNLQEGRVWTLATASISHQDTMHFAGNMFAMWLFGFNTYRVIGTRAFYGLYLLGGLACSSTHILHNYWLGRTDPPLTVDEMEWIQRNVPDVDDGTFELPPWIKERLATSDRPALGASGSVMALAAVSAALFPLDKVQPSLARGMNGLTIPLPSAVLFFVLSDLAGLTQQGSPVDHVGHLGGIAMGILYVSVGWYTKTGSFRFLHAHPTGGELPLLYRIRQWRRGQNPWQS